mmetsp:Transcript_19698/g.42411  ORF Transcript_19698/g.42411 Transcript_19698/m.42411 type:complete len:232 (+) Transcript_19698:107-802(+)
MSIRRPWVSSNRWTSPCRRATAHTRSRQPGTTGGRRRGTTRAHPIRTTSGQSSPSACRRRTSPALSTSGTRSLLRSRTCSLGGIGCAASTRSGSQAPTTPASPRRWWLRRSSLASSSYLDTTLAVRPSSARSGNTRQSSTHESPSSSAASAALSIGAGRSSQWTRRARPPSTPPLFASTTRASSTATCGSLTGAVPSAPASPISRSTTSTSRSALASPSPATQRTRPMSLA